MRRPRAASLRRLLRRDQRRRLQHGDPAPLTEHLDELRLRLFWCIGALAAAFAVAWWQHAQLLQLLAAPLPEGAPQPVTLAVAEPFLTSLKVSIYAALCVVMPIVAWHAWSFLAPAVEHGRRRSVAAFAGASALLFATGLAFGYLVALPQSLAFLVGYGDELFEVQLRASDLYRFNAIVVLASGVVFQLPVVLLGLIRFRVLTVAQLRRNRRSGWAVVAVLAVCMPGVDPVLTAVTFVPLLGLYEGTVLIGARLERRWRLPTSVAAVGRGTSASETMRAA